MSYVQQMQALALAWLERHSQWRNWLRHQLPWLSEAVLLIVAGALALVIVFTHQMPLEIEIAATKLGVTSIDPAHDALPPPRGEALPGKLAK